MQQSDAIDDLVRVTGPAPVDIALVLPWLGGLAEHHDEDVRTAAVQALAAGWTDDPDALPMVYRYVLADPSEDVRCAAVRAIAEVWPDDPRTLPWLRQTAAVDSEWVVRATAVKILAQRW